MPRYSLNLPLDLKRQAEEWAAAQGVSLNQFILWAVAEKVGGLGRALDDPGFPRVTYRRGAAGAPVAVVRGTGLRVQTIATAASEWGWEAARIAEEYELSQAQVEDALAFAAAHAEELVTALDAEERLAPVSA